MSSSKINISDLPIEVFIHILRHIPVTDRNDFRQTNKKFKHISNLHKLWLDELFNILINKTDNEIKEELIRISKEDIIFLKNKLENQIAVHFTYGQSMDETINEENSREFNRLNEILEIVQTQRGGNGNTFKFSHLPNELSEYLLLFLPRNELMNLKVTNKEHNEMINNFLVDIENLINNNEHFENKVRKMKLTKQQLENLKLYIDYFRPNRDTTSTYWNAQRLEDDYEYNQYANDETYNNITEEKKKFIENLIDKM